MRALDPKPFAALIAAAALMAGSTLATGGAQAVAETRTVGESRELAPTQAPGRTRALQVRTSDGQVLPAVLRLPARPSPGRPAMVLVHGAGPGPVEWLAPEAEAFAAAGIATLAYTKRSVGYSLTERSYSMLADDAGAAAQVLRRQPGVDPGKVGYWGLSEGGWVAPLAASRDRKAAFLVVVGANSRAPLRQQSWAERIKVEHAGVRGSLVDAYAFTSYRLLDGLGMFPEAHYDAGPVLRGLTLPLLGVWGGSDVVTPPVESVAGYRSGLEAAGNRHYTLRTVDGAEHTLRRTTTGWDRRPEFAPEYVDLVASWASKAASGAAPASSVEGGGDQPRETVATPPLRWYESAAVQGIAYTVIVLGFAGFWLTALVRRLRGRRGPRAPWSARLLPLAGLVALLGCPTYLVSLIMTGGGTLTTNGVSTVGPLLAGRPLVWLALQALAVFTAVAGVVVAVRHRPPAGDRVRTGVLLGSTAVFVVWAAYWGLLLP